MQGSLAGVVLLCAAAALPAAGARAADLSAAPPLQGPAPQYAAPAPSRHLECYAGIIAEGVNSHPDFNNIPVLAATAQDFAEGARGGGLAGCDILFANQAFLGIDMTGLYGQAKGSISINGIGMAHNVPLEGALRVRLGYMLDQQFSIYIAGGPEASRRDIVDTAGNTDSKVDYGGQVGLGIEYRFLPDWRVRGEYAFTWPGYASAAIVALPLASWNPTEHLIRVAVTRRFN